MTPDETEKRQESINLLNSTHDFPQGVMVKIIGKNTPEFLSDLRSVLDQKMGERPLHLATRETTGGRHISITIEPEFQNAEEVLALYEALRGIKEAVMLL